MVMLHLNTLRQRLASAAAAAAVIAAFAFQPVAVASCSTCGRINRSSQQ
jgi:hypothetical protein